MTTILPWTPTDTGTEGMEGGKDETENNHGTGFDSLSGCDAVAALMVHGDRGDGVRLPCHV